MSGNRSAVALVTASVAGLVGLGLVVAGMTNPAKILSFLDIAGQWDPSLLFVMPGAIAVGIAALGAGYAMCSGPLLAACWSSVVNASTA